MLQLTERPPFPEVIDSSLRRNWKSCKARGAYEGFFKYKPVGINIHLHFGGLIAKSLEVTRKAYFGEAQMTEEDAVHAGLATILRDWGDVRAPSFGSGKVKTLEACIDAHMSYFEEYPLSVDSITPLIVDGVPAVEFTFALPIPNLYHPITNKPLLYAGRFDMMAEYGSAIFICDEKTSGSLGESWSKKWRTASQITGYIWAAREYGFDVQGAIIRGIGILSKNITFLPVLAFREQWFIDRWLNQLQIDVTEMIEMWKLDYLDYALDEACSMYGGCPFVDLCTSENPELYLDTHFEEDKWDPLAKDAA